MRIVGLIMIYRFSATMATLRIEIVVNFFDVWLVDP